MSMTWLVGLILIIIMLILETLGLNWVLCYCCANSFPWIELNLFGYWVLRIIIIIDTYFMTVNNPSQFDVIIVET